jgi:ankyrin repeat protein
MAQSIKRFHCLVLLLVALMPFLVQAKDEAILVLASAIGKGELETIERLLAGGLDPNQRVPGAHLQYTPLALAVNANQLAITRALLKAGADPRIEDGNGDTVMTMAADPEHLPMAKLLIEHGVSIDVRNKAGITALMRVAPYAASAEIKTILDLGADPNLVDPEGNSALMLAVGNNKLATVELLVTAGAKVDLLNKNGQSALQLVFDIDGYKDESEATPEIVKLLINHGANINQRDSEERTPLLRAVSSLYLKPLAIRALLDFKPDIRVRDKDGRDALFHTVLKDNPKLPYQRLIELGADVTTVDNDDTDLLMLAAGNSNPEQVRFFLDKGLSPKNKDKQGASAVHDAARCGRYDSSPEVRELTAQRTVKVLKLLESHGGSLTSANAEGLTPLHFAAIAGTAPVVAYLLPHYPAADLPDQDGDTPLHLAAGYGSVSVIELLLPAYTSIDLRNGEESTPLMTASASGHQDCILRLLAAGANINAVDKNGVSAFSAAFARDDIAHVRFLLEHGADPKSLADPDAELLRAARQFHLRPIPLDDYFYLIDLLSGIVRDVNSLDADKMSALMWVSASNQLPALKALLKHHPDLNLRSPDGRTALMWAASSGASEVMQALREAGADGALRDSTGRTATELLEWLRSAKSTSRIELPEGATSLFERVKRSRQEALRDYLKQDDWSLDDRVAGIPPLHLAAALGDIDAIGTLLKRGAPPNQRIGDQSTPLMEAAANGHLEAVEFLLGHGADPALRGTHRQRAIDHAVGYGHAEIARLLLAQNDSLCADETLLLINLVRRGDKELLRDFLKAGASIPPPGQRVDGGEPFGNKTTSSDTPLLAAAVHVDREMLRMFFEFATATGADDRDFLISALHHAADAGRLDNIRFLVEERKVDPNAILSDSLGGVFSMGASEPEGKGEKPIKGFSALSRALENEHDEVVRYLVQKGAAITGRTRSGGPPLNFVVEHHRQEMLRFFLKNKAPTHFVDFNGRTALHVAAESNDEASVRLLLEHGANPQTMDSKGLTPLDLATRKQAGETIALLKKHAK